MTDKINTPQHSNKLMIAARFLGYLILYYILLNIFFTYAAYTKDLHPLNTFLKLTLHLMIFMVLPAFVILFIRSFSNKNCINSKRK